MKKLAINTATSGLDIIVINEQNSFELQKNFGFKHAENLLRLIDFSLSESNLNLNDLDLLICAKGPGSFTGLRIGISTLKGLSAATGIPLVSVPTLSAMAYGYDFFDGAVLPILDAKKKRIYTAIYKAGEQKSDFLDISINDLVKKLHDYDRVLLTGNDAEKFLPQFTNHDNSKFFLDTHYKKNIAFALSKLGEEHYTKYGADSKSEGALYLRKSDAELSLLEKKIRKDR